MSELEHMVIKHVYREGNRSVNILAKLQRQVIDVLGTSNVFHTSPSFLFLFLIWMEKKLLIFEKLQRLKEPKHNGITIRSIWPNKDGIYTRSNATQGSKKKESRQGANQKKTPQKRITKNNPKTTSNQPQLHQRNPKDPSP